MEEISFFMSICWPLSHNHTPYFGKWAWQDASQQSPFSLYQLHRCISWPDEEWTGWWSCCEFMVIPAANCMRYQS